MDSMAEQSRSFITEALFALLEKDGYGDISVTDITRKAGVGRATFYRHFSDKNDIIRQYFCTRMEAYNKTLRYKPRSRTDYAEMVERILCGIREQKPLFEMLLKSGLESIYLRFLTDAMTETINAVRGGDNFFRACYAAGALFNVSLEWVKGGCVEPESDLSRLYVDMMFPKKTLEMEGYQI